MSEEPISRKILMGIGGCPCGPLNVVLEGCWRALGQGNKWVAEVPLPHFQISPGNPPPKREELDEGMELQPRFTWARASVSPLLTKQGPMNVGLVFFFWLENVESAGGGAFRVFPISHLSLEA